MKLGYFRRDKPDGKSSGKNPRLTAILYINGGEAKVSFTISHMDYDELDVLREYLTGELKGAMFKDTAEMEKTGWDLILKYKADREITVSRFEFNKTVPADVVKIGEISIGRIPISTMLYLHSNAFLGKQRKTLRVSLGIPKLPGNGDAQDRWRDNIIEQVDGLLRLHQYTTFADASAGIKGITRDVLVDMNLLDQDVLDATLEGNKGKVMSAILQKRNARKTPPKGSNRE